MSDIAVRPAVTGDGREMARIWLAGARYYAELEPELFRVPYEEGLAEAFETGIRVNRADHELQLVAEDDGRLLGMVEARVVEPVEDAGIQLVRYVGERHVMIDSLMVDPTSWRQGIGAALMDAVETWARERGAVLARLDTFAESPVSLPFYERQGYRRRSVIFEKPL